jgi:hypothetical protein
MTDLDIRTIIGSREVLVTVNCSLSSKSQHWATIVICAQSGEELARADHLEAGRGGFNIEFSLPLKDVSLWYPVGYGEQPMYSCEVRIADKVCLP